MNLNELAILYRKTKSDKTLGTIFKLIDPDIKKKSHYIYFKKWRRKKAGKFIDNEGLLVRSNLIDYIDVEQELKLDVLKLINTYNTSFLFEGHYRTLLYFWKPSFVNKDFFIRVGYTVSGDEELNETGLTRFDTIAKEDNKPIVEITPLNEREEKILKEISLNPNITQEELGKILKVSQDTISLSLIELRKKIKYCS